MIDFFLNIYMNDMCVFCIDSTSETCVDQYELFGFMVVVLVLLPFCCLGVCCMHMIETPLRNPNRVFSLKKEY